jgi:hypothetical protein
MERGFVLSLCDFLKYKKRWFKVWHFPSPFKNNNVLMFLEI